MTIDRRRTTLEDRLYPARFDPTHLDRCEFCAAEAKKERSMAEQVTVGRIVHYVSYGTPGGEYGKECRAAIVTAVEEGSIVSLCVMNPSGLFFNHGVLLDLDHAGGTWHWPERA